MPRVILDENVSLQVADRLQSLGYDVLAVVQQPQRGLEDSAVFALATHPTSTLITRDLHFTNPLRFPPDQTAGILFVTPGNLTGRQEADLIEQFLQTHPPPSFHGHLVLLSPQGIFIR